MEDLSLRTPGWGTTGRAKCSIWRQTVKMNPKDDVLRDLEANRGFHRHQTGAFSGWRVIQEQPGQSPYTVWRLQDRSREFVPFANIRVADARLDEARETRRSRVSDKPVVARSAFRDEGSVPEFDLLGDEEVWWPLAPTELDSARALAPCAAARVSTQFSNTNNVTIGFTPVTVSGVF
jgi:hypothetical protein